MAIRYAVATGNWSNVATWDGGASIPASGDYVYANSYTVTVDQDITVAKISTEICPTTSVGGGGFVSSVSRIIIANVKAGTTPCISSAPGTYNQHFQIIGNSEGGTVAGAYGVYVTVSNGQTGVISIAGNSNAGSGAASTFINNNTSVRFGILNVNGNMTSTSSIPAHLNSIGGTLTINHTGNATSGGFYVANPSILNFTGIATASSTSPAYVAFNTNSIANIDGQLNNVNSTMAIAGFYFMYLSSSSTTVWTFYDETNTKKPLYTSDVVENPPAESDVRDGVIYGVGNIYEGTLNVGATPAEFVAALVASDLGIRLSKCSTVEITGEQIASYNV